ncbi:MAG: hypothetical protein ABI369_04895 [Acetobacteraceae bacterium]
MSAGLVKLNVLVPLMKLAEFDALLAQWRAEARAQLNFDQPTAEHILLIHSICRALRIRLPVSAFATRLTAEAWLREQQPHIEARRLEMPRLPKVT